VRTLPPPLEQLQLLLTERCNLTCTHCAVPEETSPALHELDTAQWTAFIERVLGSGVRRIVLSGGEALLRTDCLAIAEHALTAGADAVVIVTNGTVLPTTTSARLAQLQRQWPGLLLHVSIDGAHAASHDLIRGGGSFDRTMAGLARVRAAGGRVDGVHSVIHRRNVEELDAIVGMVRALGAKSWTLFPVAALGRGVDLDALRLGQQAWEQLLRRLATDPPYGLDLGIMGPTIGDEWTDALVVPAPRAVHSPQAVIGPDGAVFTCPPLRHATAGQVLEVIEGTPWIAVDTALRSSLAEACPTCKYRSLCTGVDPGAPLLVSGTPFGEPALSGAAAGDVSVSIGRSLR
jgi:radical SAM protein with 4Fe4S-binding SPASM domain